MTNWVTDGLGYADILVLRIERNLEELKLNMKKAQEELNKAQKEIEHLRREHHASTRV